jgi:hypothetical protein
MTFLLSEDKALRDLLKGMTVTDQKDPSANRTVNVWFGQPDQEIAAQTYPYITIDMIDVSEDFERSMRGLIKPMYLPDPVEITESVPFNPLTNNWNIHMPVPVNIDYQITIYSRQPRHDRELLAQVMYARLPLRFGTLSVDDNNSQGTVRRLDVLDISKRDVTEQGKRLFVNAFTIRVSSEMTHSTYTKYYKVSQVSVQGVEGTPAPGQTVKPFNAIKSFTIPQQ